MKITRLILTTLFSVFISGIVTFGQNTLSIQNIPFQLFENADAIVRIDQTTFKLVNISRALRTHKRVITILNENALYHARISIPYNKNNRILTLKGKVFDGEGKLINYLESSDFRDESNIPFGMLYTDSRVKKADLFNAKFPFTIEIYYVILTKDILVFPEVFFQPDNRTSVISSTFELLLPKDISFRYKGFNLSGLVDSSFKRKFTTYTWHEQNIKAFRDEDFSSPVYKRIPHLQTTANKIKFKKVEGTISTWKSFGKWVFDLNAISGELPLDLINELKSMVKDIPDQVDRVKILYEYLQANTRYVNVSYDIGGFRPSPPITVYNLGYGDCKALTMYMRELLKCVGINSYYALVNAGSDEEDIDTSWPSFQFNHAILCVPMTKDTIWLECTSQTLPFGFLGSFTDDRFALIISEVGGKLARTTKYDEKFNKRHLFAEVQLYKMGDAKASLSLFYGGLQYDYINFDYLMESGREVQREWLYESISIPAFFISDWVFIDDRNRIPQAEISLNLTITDFLAVSNERLYFRPNLVLKWLYVPIKQENRENNLYFSESYFDSITIDYTIPYGAEIEYIPENKIIVSKFGEYNYHIEFLETKKIRFTRSLIIRKGEYPPEDFNRYVDFVRQILKSDKERIILIKS